MTDKTQLRNMLNNLINDKTAEAELELHNYLTDKMREVVGVNKEDAEVQK